MLQTFTKSFNSKVDSQLVNFFSNAQANYVKCLKKISHLDQTHIIRKKNSVPLLHDEFCIILYRLPEKLLFILSKSAFRIQFHIVHIKNTKLIFYHIS